MEYRRLGTSGLKLSELSFGSWITFGNQIDYDHAAALMDIAYDSGVNFFDNAEVYANGESERVMGEILHKRNWDRTSYTISSKVFFGSGSKLPTAKGLHRKHIREACDAALSRLQTDYIDLFFCHRPDKETPIEETVWSMHQLILQGKILYWGTSEWSAQEITAAHAIAERHHLIGPVMEQPQYNMLHRDKVEVEFKNLYRTYGLGTTIWSPLASGYLTGKYLSGTPSDSRLARAELSWLNERLQTDTNRGKVLQLADVARDLNCSLAQLAVAWCLKNTDVSTVLLGATSTAQLKETLCSAEFVGALTPDIMERIEGILQNKPKAPAF
jgi:voltage-dependent potassium channel beta subunit